MQNRKVFFSVLVLVPVIIIFTAVTALTFLSAVPDEVTELNVRLSWFHQAQFAGMYVAKDNGYYTSKNLEVVFKEYESGVDQITELENGAVDFTIISAREYLQTIDDGSQLIALGAVYQTSPYALIALEDSGISSPLDFTGKRLGRKGGSEASLLVYNALLSRFEIDPLSVDYISLDFSQAEWQELEANTVDVIDLYRTDQVYLFEQEEIDYNLIKPEDHGFSAYGDIIVTRRSFAEENQTLVENFMKETVRGWNFALDNQELAVEIILPYTSDDYNDTDYQAFILAQSEGLIRPQDNRGVGVMNFLSWNKTYQQMTAAGLIDASVDIAEVYTNSFLH